MMIEIPRLLEKAEKASAANHGKARKVSSFFLLPGDWPKARITLSLAGGSLSAMRHENWHTIRSFIRRLPAAWFGRQGIKGAFFLLSATLLSIGASGQVAVTSFPYILKYKPSCTPTAGCVITITGAQPTAPTPPAVSASGFSSLMGGGFGALVTSVVAPNLEAAATAATIAGLERAAIVKSVNFVESEQARLAANAQQALQNQEARFASCSDVPDAVKASRNAVRARLGLKHHSVKAMDETVCTLPEEEASEEAQQELQELNEAGNATQEALEAAEEAADAAEVAAEAAEEAAEAAEIGIDVLESILDACAVF